MSHLHDTYWIVGHFHYVMFGGTGMGFFAALLYWFPKMFGKTYNEKIASLAWIPIFIGFNMLYFSMLVLGYMGMPRRYFTHLPQYHPGHVVASIGGFHTGVRAGPVFRQSGGGSVQREKSGTESLGRSNPGMADPYSSAG